MRPRSYGLAVLLATVLVIVAAGCSTGPQQLRDLEKVPAQDPQKAELYNNLDQYPNIVLLCTHGVAFATTTRDYLPIMRVPELDKSWCQSQSDGAALQ